MNECYIIITIIIESYHAEHSMVYFVLYIYGYGCYNAGIIHKWWLTAALATCGMYIVPWCR